MVSLNTEESVDDTTDLYSLSFDVKNNFYILDGGFTSHLLSKCTKSQKDLIENKAENDLWGSYTLVTPPDDPLNSISREVYKDYLKAGCDILTSNTYQTSIDALSQSLIKDHKRIISSDKDSVPESILFPNDDKRLREDYLPNPKIKAVECFKSAVDEVRQSIISEIGCDVGSVHIAGSVGPYGACLQDLSEYSGSYIAVDNLDGEKSSPRDSKMMNRKQLADWHFDRIKHLLCAGVTFIAAETIPSVVEGLAILDVVSKFPEAKCWISFQCRDGKHSALGERFDRVVQRLLSHEGAPHHLIGVGVNCTSPEHVTPLLRLANKVNVCDSIPYVVYPNGGENAQEHAIFMNSILDNVKTWMSLGANVIGGCCGINPEDIKSIRSKLIESIPEALDFRHRTRVEYNRLHDLTNLDVIRKQMEVDVSVVKCKKRNRDLVNHECSVIFGHSNQLELDKELNDLLK